MNEKEHVRGIPIVVFQSSLSGLWIVGLSHFPEINFEAIFTLSRRDNTIITSSSPRHVLNAVRRQTGSLGYKSRQRRRFGKVFFWFLAKRPHREERPCRAAAKPQPFLDAAEELFAERLRQTRFDFGR